MIKLIELSRKLKRDVEYIDNVAFGNYECNKCICVISFKSLAEVSITWNKQLIILINTYIKLCDAQLNWQSTKNNLVIMFQVKLS